jgi:hypothetical protein
MSDKFSLPYIKPITQQRFFYNITHTHRYEPTQLTVHKCTFYSYNYLLLGALLL